MSDTTLKFGTDGWRAVIGAQYTFDNVARVAQATAVWMRETYPENNVVVIGHDTRFQGRAFSEHAARVFAANGLTVLFGDDYTATPAVSWATREYEAAAGIVLTASHNPPQWNGFKVKANFGGPALPAMIAEIEALIGPLSSVVSPLPLFDDLVAAGTVRLMDLAGAYRDMIRATVDLDAIRASGVRMVHDAMFGAGRGMFTELLGADSVVELRSADNPGFEGGAPEPIERNLAGLCEVVVAEGCDAGIANDGDADRIGMVDAEGRFVDSHRLLALLVRHMHETRGMRGDVVKTFSTTDLLDRMTKAYGLKLHTTPIGFKYVCELIMDGDILVGGEESGGLAVKGHLPERDGIYIGLLILEMMAVRKRSLAQLVDELFEEFGPIGYHRVDVHTTPEHKATVLRLLKNEGGLKEIAGTPVTRLETLDGYKHRTKEGWLLVRPSGTEPVLRIYAEAGSESAAQAMVASAVASLGV